MSASDLAPIQHVHEYEHERVGDSGSSAPEWWPLAHSTDRFVPLDRQQCRRFLGLSGAGWVSRPSAASTPRLVTSYSVNGSVLRFVPPSTIELGVGEVVLFQVAHFDARARTAWSVVLLGPSAGDVPAPRRRHHASLPVALPLASAGIFGSTLAAPAR